MKYVKCLFGFSLVPKSDESSNYVSNKSSDDKEEEESDEISIYYRAVWAHSCSFACYIVDFAACLYSGIYSFLFI